MPFERKKKNQCQKDLFAEGLAEIITIIPFHTHYLTSAETLRFLPAKNCREQFEDYFGNSLEPAEAAKYYKEVLVMKSNFQKLKRKVATYANNNTEVAYEENPFAVLIGTPIM
ncbi:hypothetical protein HNY73_017936 [Argiope bruennichi]|uniref:Uncharacterized protein n=1 Tax=Argiope bruennichi TaxID=94029 RepID=A0A8T0EG70_ARGBR|nr:hypothetical protein HNY73_017936 [Argiope bruennichi]